MSKNECREPTHKYTKIFYNYKKRVIILQLFSIALLRARVRHARTHSISETLRISLRRNTTLIVGVVKRSSPARQRLELRGRAQDEGGRAIGKYACAKDWLSAFYICKLRL